MKLLHHAQTAFWVFMATAGFLNLYGTIRTQMDKQQPKCQPPIVKEVQP